MSSQSLTKKILFLLAISVYLMVHLLCTIRYTHNPLILNV